MSLPAFESLPPAIAHALAERGFTSLTTVQEAVLEPGAIGRDLRITSQTGSGKTVAVGFALREVVTGAPQGGGSVAKPLALVIAPTRELAKQFEEELTWLFKHVGAKVVSVTGGSAFRDERRALQSGAAVVVGTPGRLLDHLNRGSVDPTGLQVVILDEADRMLDMGFRDELEAILALVPDEHRTHLVSATFPREVQSLANRVQKDPLHVEGTRLGEANADIEHVVHLVMPDERMSALVNLLLAHPEDRTLIFARTRADVADIAHELDRSGFSARAISGDLEQPERVRVLGAFKRGDLRVLVATDVAARGIDVQDVTRVLHAEPPGDADSYTHRSGRTGRAGKKGISAILAAPRELGQCMRILHRAGVPYQLKPLPTPEAIRRARDERLLAELSSEDAEVAVDERLLDLARRLVSAAPPERTVARLLAQLVVESGPEPREVRVLEPPRERERTGDRTRPGAARRDVREPVRSARPVRDRPAPQGDRPPPAPRFPSERPPERFPSERPVAADRPPPRPRAPREEGPSTGPEDWVAFRVSWGAAHGADPRRLLALACRRGGIKGTDVGAIRVGEASSVIEVARAVGDAFEEKVAEPDPRDPRVRFRRDQARAPVAAAPRARSPRVVAPRHTAR